MLKPLTNAIRDHDHIYATVIFLCYSLLILQALIVHQILGTSIASTGSNLPLNVPNPDTYRRCMVNAFKNANRDVTDVDYLELHATGNPMFDIFGWVTYFALHRNICW